MDFSFSREQVFFREQFKKTLNEVVAPHAATIDHEDAFPHEIFKKIGNLGYYGIRYPQEIGGMGADCTTFTIFAEELASISVSFAAIATMQCLMGTDFLFRFGNSDIKERVLLPAIRGEKIGTIAFTEPDCGSDLGAIKTRAIKKGDEYILKGRKLWITNAEVADFVTVVATVEPSKRLNGLAFFLVEKGTPGFYVGQKIEKMSARGSITGELIFDECHIPASNLLGEEGKGAQYLESILSEIRVMIAGLGIGLARAAFEAGKEYSRQREAFGKQIGNFQLIQEKIAEMETRIKSAWLLTYYAAWLKDHKESAVKEAAMAKLYSTETASFVVDQVTRIYGSYGIANEYPVERYFRDARFLLFGGGTSEILKTVIARESLKK
ncbi:MAG: acyl-CoA dehydrogenase family protein [Syntrophorhabdaceae bacterium]|nr:acyl-CoA dehydrogenase family protein [Syntrophorhabdaceae bacterium]